MAELTKIEHLINPLIFQDTVNAKRDKMFSMFPFATVDNTLNGVPGTTIKISRFTFDGIAKDIKEGEAVPMRNLGTESANYEVKHAAIGISISDIALMSASGDVLGNIAQQLVEKIYSKVDTEMYNELLKAKSVLVSTDTINYNNVVDAIGLFEAETIIDMVMFVHPHNITALRKDPNFIDKNKYGNNVMVNGEIGMIGNARIVPSRRATPVGGFYYSPIILTNDPEHNDVIPAVTYFIKRDMATEPHRDVLHKQWDFTADQVYVVALTNDAKVAVLKTVGADIMWKKMYEDTYHYPDTNVNLLTTPVDGKIALTRTNATTWAAALALDGTARTLDELDRTALGFDSSATHYITGCIEIPGAGISDTAPAVTYNGTAVPANNMEKIDASWYVDIVFGVKDNGSGNVVSASGNTTFTMVAGGITTTFTPDFSKVVLA